MVTETIVLDRMDGSWRSVVNTGSYLVLAGMTGKIRLRYGISSTSEGMLIDVDDVIIADETVYIQPINQKIKGGQYITVYVTKA